MHNGLRLSEEVKVRLTEALGGFSKYRILVVGDVMLDTFIWGQVRRISPEAPVPIVEVSEETQLLGGTANVVHNVAALGGKVIVAGIVGNDGAGRELVRLLRRVSVPTDGLIVEQDRPTTRKTRIIAQNQQVVRFDQECRKPLQSGSMNRMLSYIQENLPRTDGLIVSDYAKGVVTPELMDAIRSFVADSSIPVIVDPKVQHIEMYRRVTMITPNHHEASRMAGVEIQDEPTLIRAGRYLLEKLECETVLITRGREGMSLFHRDGQVVHIPTIARRVYDVTGAGDTANAALTLGIVAGLSMVDAAHLANIAAGIVVGEVGTAAVSCERLSAIIQAGCAQ
jgi:D-beta-D-heptose 7-phosphate kinase/D-beta-D-heptose 1-phosphate adenosyltransferase